MPWTNYHSHTYYCDGKNPPEDYIQEALYQKLPAYGYSSHAPVPFDCEWTIPQRKINNYLNDIKALRSTFRNKIQIYIGLEVDYIPCISGPQHVEIKKLGLDYTIGSIHFVDSFKNGKKWCIDWTPDFFFNGVKNVFNGNIKNAVLRYFELTREMLENSPPDILGHFDKIRMHNNNFSHFDETENWYKNAVEDLLHLIKKKNVIVEINTRGYYKAGSNLYPHPWCYNVIKQLGIPVSINSDAHSPDEITKGYKYAANVLLDSGIDEIWSLVEGKWKPFKFDPVKGIGL